VSALSPKLATQSPRMIKTCWVVTTGTAGAQNQAFGLAEAISRSVYLDISVKHIAIKSPWQHLPGSVWPNPFTLLTAKGHLMRAPYPDLWIAAGRQTVPLTIALKKRFPETFTIQLQDPKAPSSLFDMVIPPSHDKVSGDSVFSILGAPSRVTVEKIDEFAAALESRFDGLSKPRAAVLIGGSNRVLKMTNHVIDRLCENLEMIVSEGTALIISNSRRTKDSHWIKIRERMSGENVAFVDCRESASQDGVYPGILGLVDYILVTEDSVNMIGEATASGKPVYRFPLEGKAGKFSRFFDELEARGALRVFEGRFVDWQYSPINETARAAEEIVRRWAPD